MSDLIEHIQSILPQTQCTKCGYEGCAPYAQGMLQGEAINRCPPGGTEGIQALAHLLNRSVEALNPECGTHLPLQRAIIDEQHCIGCTLCIQACPVDAIVGANKYMHTVVADLCTGCDLCIAPCPVDCISMVPAGRSWRSEDAYAARQRYESRKVRLQQNATQTQAQQPSSEATKQAAIAEALAKARARRMARLS